LVNLAMVVGPFLSKYFQITPAELPTMSDMLLSP
jgi:hypothetical protein